MHHLGSFPGRVVTAASRPCEDLLGKGRDPDDVLVSGWNPGYMFGKEVGFLTCERSLAIVVGDLEWHGSDIQGVSLLRMGLAFIGGWAFIKTSVEREGFYVCDSWLSLLGVV